MSETSHNSGTSLAWIAHTLYGWEADAIEAYIQEFLRQTQVGIDDIELVTYHAYEGTQTRSMISLRVKQQ